MSFFAKLTKERRDGAPQLKQGDAAAAVIRAAAVDYNSYEGHAAGLKACQARGNYEPRGRGARG